MNQVSSLDEYIYKEIRRSVNETIIEGVGLPELKKARILDIAPQVHAGVKAFSKPGQVVETLDIDDRYGTTYKGDICSRNPELIDGIFDAVFFLEVIEHVLDPQSAIREIFRILRPGGILFATSPFNFRIHGPLPDCWRISEHGWRHLLKDFCEVKIEALEDKDRFLMPFHYRISAQKPL